MRGGIMYFADAIYTHDTAQEVASALTYLRQDPAAKLMRLNVVSSRKASGSHRAHTSDKTYWVGYDDSLPDPVTLANGGEVVHMRTEEGLRLDILFGRPAERDLGPALVLIESS